MSGLLERIGQLAVFLICAQTLNHLRANDSYEKYIKLLVSMMLLILLLEPLGAVFRGNVTGELTERIKVYEDKLQEIIAEPQLYGEDVENMLQNITEKKVQEGMEYAEKEETQVAEPVSTEGSIEHIQLESEPIIVEEINLGGNDGQSAESP